MRHNKYGAVQTIGDDGTTVFDSRLEAQCARVLDLLVSQGRIATYGRQIAYELAPRQPERGLRAVRYLADFWVLDSSRQHGLVVECKGLHTPASRLKLRWFQDKYPHIPLCVVHVPEEVVAAVDDLDRAANAKENSHAQHTGTH